MNAIEEVINKYVGLHQYTDGTITVSLYEGETEGGQHPSMIIVDSRTFPGLTMEMAETFAKRLRDSLEAFAFDVLDAVDYWTR